MLEAAGHEVVAKDLLSEPWTTERLRSFFGDMPVTSWFNPAAPRIKSGEIKPQSFNDEAALILMLADPLLIRRPLIEADGQKCAGFDREPVVSLLGNHLTGEDVQSCSRHDQATQCPDPRTPQDGQPS